MGKRVGRDLFNADKSISKGLSKAGQGVGNVVERGAKDLGKGADKYLSGPTKTGGEFLGAIGRGGRSQDEFNRSDFIKGAATIGLLYGGGLAVSEGLGGGAAAGEGGGGAAAEGGSGLSGTQIAQLGMAGQGQQGQAQPKKEPTAEEKEFQRQKQKREQEEKQKKFEFAMGLGKLVKGAYDPSVDGVEAGAELVGNMLKDRQKKKIRSNFSQE